jgi:hypothetical protein
VSTLSDFPDTNLPHAVGGKAVDHLPDLVHLSGSFTDAEKARLAHVLRQAEQRLALPNVPASAGARWAIVAERDGLMAISRLGVSYVFAAASLQALLEKLQRWIREQSRFKSEATSKS